jgi:hypothetical protein
MLYGVAGLLLAGAWWLRGVPVIPWAWIGVALLTLVAAAAFHYLTVRDEGDRLAVRFGPLPLLGRQIIYAEIETVEAGRTSFIDGWGVHWIPGRGTTYNLSGFDCARLTLRNGRVIRIGSDDVENLVAFLRSRIAAPE